MRFLMIGFAGCDAFVEQRRILLSIEEASFGTTMFFLPADNGATGRFIKFSVDPGLKPERLRVGQTIFIPAPQS